MNTDMRDSFEAWATEKGWPLGAYTTNCGIEDYSMYGHPPVQRQWEAYQQAWADSRKQEIVLPKTTWVAANWSDKGKSENGYTFNMIKSACDAAGYIVKDGNNG